MKSLPWAVAAVAIGLTALTVVVAVVVQIAHGNRAPVVMPSVPITVALPVALGFGARAAWRKALSREGAPPVVDERSWQAPGE
ncbi:hypothetical protein ACFWVC_23620 [Streptomyces sp. NPDC058691]|uniref:hypothetical protein n=1 Tax=Streptomyces sp. NPDC058691 TaxID=3346601 RepID=UPI003665A3C1